jgi:chromosome segregation ATPase
MIEQLYHFQVSSKIKDLEKLLTEKETFIENMLTNKQELERKFEVELDMLKNQHEIELLSLEQQLQDAHQEKIDELQTSLNNEKQVSGQLQEEGIKDQGSSAEINLLHEELMSTKLKYENKIFDLKQELEMVKYEKEDLVKRQEDDSEEINSIKEKYKEEIETLKYQVQEKEVLINDLTNSEDKISQGSKLYNDEDVTRKLEELRQELTTQHEQHLKLANELWRKKFEEHEGTGTVW